MRFEYIVRVAMALGRANELENLFQPAIDSIADVNRYEATATRQRVRKHGKAKANVLKPSISTKAGASAGYGAHWRAPVV